MCAMRCPADIKHYHVGQLARRLRGKYIDPDSENLKIRLEELKDGKYVKEVDELVNMGKDEIVALYKKRKIEAKGELDEEVVQ